MPENEPPVNRPRHWRPPSQPARPPTAVVVAQPTAGAAAGSGADVVDSATSSDLLPVRMLNEFAYCPRLFHFMHVEGRWADNAFTEDGKAVHRRVDSFDDPLPAPEPPSAPRRRARRKQSDVEDTGDDPPKVARSVNLGSERLGLIAKLDLVSTAGDEAVPVDTKRGRVPSNPERSWEPERVQLMAQGLLLRDHGYRCDHGVLYFAGSRTRVEVPFTPELEARTLHLMEQARLAATRTDLPDPLDDSPKCNGCSLSGICLPDETLALREVAADPATPDEPAVRRLYPQRDEALPFYVQKQGASVGKQSKRLIVRYEGEEVGAARLKDVSQLVLCGGVRVSPQTIHLLCEAGVTIVHLSRGHWFYGVTNGITLRNAYDRAAQFAVASRPERCLEFARAVVTAKALNQRTMLRRNARPQPKDVLTRMRRLLRDVRSARSPGALLGIEGSIASLYFEHFGRMLRPKDLDTDWNFAQRNRRPPRDSINALLSFGYALLAKEATVALLSEGLDPWWGFFHQPRHGRPALALDLMEEFRPLIVDSTVITAVNTGMLSRSDFVVSASGCALKDRGRRTFIQAYEARLDQLVTHPLFGYRCSWRAVLRVQARLLARWLRGDVAAYTGIVTR